MADREHIWPDFFRTCSAMDRSTHTSQLNNHLIIPTYGDSNKLSTIE